MCKLENKEIKRNEEYLREDIKLIWKIGLNLVF